VIVNQTVNDGFRINMGINGTEATAAELANDFEMNAFGEPQAYCLMCEEWYTQNHVLGCAHRNNAW
jgi:hypothetical protein